MQKLMDKTQDEVRQLPKPPSSDAQMELLHLISDFVRDVSRHLEGTPEETGLLQSIRHAEDKFKLAIRYTAPDFRAHEKPKLGVRFALPAGKAGSKDDGSDAKGDISDEAGTAVGTDRGDHVVPHPDFLTSEDKYDFRPRNDDNAIYIDEVMQRARR